MAGGKKKKKLAANPARGFATTSIASKSKPERIADLSNETSETSSIVTAPTSIASEDAQVTAVAKVDQSRELHELSPEELEAQLELSELQSHVEQQGPKARKEATRQVSRLKTDRRLLRSQADQMSVREWLPDELMQQIVELISEEPLLPAPIPDTKVGFAKNLTEETLLARVWQLHLIFSDLGIEDNRLRLLLQYVLSNPPAELSLGGAWGLSEALDWLALHCGVDELPEYEASRAKTLSQVYGDFGPDVSVAGYESIEQSDPHNSEAAPGHLPQEEIDPMTLEQDLNISDMDSDLDPDEMLSTYIRTKVRLFELEGNAAGGKRQQQSDIHARPTRPLLPAEVKLQQRLRALESDVLFDKREADFQWSERKNDLLRDEALRKRLHLSEGDQNRSKRTNGRDGSSEAHPSKVMEEAEQLGKELLEADTEDGEGLLSAMFDAPMESHPSVQPAGTHIASENVSLRNFGKVTGMSARRILEDACRSRDSGVRLHFKMISPTTYACRHSVTISWSKDQDPVEAAYMTELRVMSRERSLTVMMVKLAATDVLQSESFAATIALFLLFSNSPKEEKAALRLPPAFRDVWQELAELKREQTDGVDRLTVKSLLEIVREQAEKDEEEDVVLTAAFRNRSKVASGTNTPSTITKAAAPSATETAQPLIDLWVQKASTPSYQHMLVGRQTLPMFQYRDIALSAVRQNQVTILCGETGCGKSTQMPSFILEDELSRGRHCKIYCTEPRRISAISLAQRVSEELGEAKGAVGTARSLVGYAIRLESHAVASTRLIYATVGIVLRMLESAKGLDEITHLVIDEIHERSIDTDFLLIVLRSLLLRRPDLKVVLMSATVDAQRFSQYLDNAPIVTVPGRTFPVQAMFLEDAIELTDHTVEDSSYGGRQDEAENEEDDDEARSSTTIGSGSQLAGYKPKTIKTLKDYDEYKVDFSLIVKLLEKVAYQQQYNKFSKAILIFLPGIAEIRQLNDILLGHPSFARGWLVYPLHSSFSSEEQQQAFLVPPQGLRKIVLATNIAETGITIPDVTCVIDTGKHKEMRFDERRQLSRLIQSFISRANAKQRRGRAGRVQEGICFHLFTKHRHDEIMAEQQTPEMLRLSLQDLVMRVKICKLGDIEQALSAALDPPSLKNIRRAIDALIEVNALTSGEELTPLGRQLAKLPLDAQLGKLILLASTFGCLDAALTCAAILSSKSPFVAPMNAKKQADTVRLGFKRSDSDMLTAYNAYTAWRHVCTTPSSSEMQFCKKNFLSQQNLANIEDLKSQLLASLADAGFVELDGSERSALFRVRQSGRNRTFVAVPASQNYAEANDILINSVTAWSFYPKVLIRDGKGWRNVANNQSISLHPSSVNKGVSIEAKFLSFYSIMQSSSRFTNAQETAPVSDMALVLLAGDAVFHMYAGVIVIDGNRLRFKVNSWRIMLVLKTLRARVKDILARAFKTPGKAMSERQTRWMDIFLGMFERVNKGKGR